MALVVAGIDEAGYGPRLGPLCVGLAAFRVPGWTPGDPPPCLWRLLRAGVARSPRDARGRVPVADSKRLKLPNASPSGRRHPLRHLEPGVLAFLRCLGVTPACDAELFAHLGVRLDDCPWYGGEPIPLPVARSPAEIGVAASRLGRALEQAGVELVRLRCLTVGEAEINRIIRTHHTKAQATLAALGAHLRDLWSHPTPGNAPLRIVADQLGGRTAYGDVLARYLPTVTVVPLRQREERSAWRLVGTRGSKTADVVVHFMPEAEQAHLPVALASMVAKFVRELAMARFNRYWCARRPELKPTAGYGTDAARWLREAAAILSPSERAAIVRIL